WNRCRRHRKCPLRIEASPARTCLLRRSRRHYLRPHRNCCRLGPGDTRRWWLAGVSRLFDPIGFIAVIIGRQQLFTENTLYPVVLVLDERKHLLSTLRLWAVVFISNIAGALLFAALCTYTTALKPDIKTKLVELGVTAVQGS